MKEPLQFPYHDADHGGAYCVPRRFDLATMMVMTAGYAVMFTLLRLLEFETVLFVYFAGLVTSVAVAQSLTYLRYSPRAVSVLTGIGYFLVFALFTVWNTNSDAHFNDLSGILCCLGVTGPIQGYLAGAMVAGVFLLSDYWRRFLTALRTLIFRTSGLEDDDVQSPWDAEQED